MESQKWNQLFPFILQWFNVATAESHQICDIIATERVQPEYNLELVIAVLDKTALSSIGQSRPFGGPI
jgi:hypothetical protein